MYQPSGPYVIQSGKRRGKALEMLMFENYAFLRWFLVHKLNSNKTQNKNSLHRHLEWLVEQGESRQPTLVCPQCGQGPIKYFSVVYNYDGDVSIDSGYTCCDKTECREALAKMALEKTCQLLPIRFSSLLRFSNKSDRRRATKLFRQVFGLPERLTRNEAFRFFARQR